MSRCEISCEERNERFKSLGTPRVNASLTDLSGQFGEPIMREGWTLTAHRPAKEA